MPTFTDYELYTILNENGYNPTNRNLRILKEGLCIGAMAICHSDASVDSIKEALVNTGYKPTDRNVFKVHDALQEGTLVITEEPTYDKIGDEIFVKDHKTKKLRSVANQKEHDEYARTGGLMYRKNADGDIEQGVVGPDGKYRNVHGKYGDGEPKIAYVERKDAKAAAKSAIGNLVGKKK